MDMYLQHTVGHLAHQPPTQSNLIQTDKSPHAFADLPEQKCSKGQVYNELELMNCLYLPLWEQKTFFFMTFQPWISALAFKDLSTHSQISIHLHLLSTHLEIFLHVYKSDYAHMDYEFAGSNAHTVWDIVTQLSIHICKEFCYNNTPIHY